MTPKEEEKLKKKARTISVMEGSGYSVMEGFGMRYITPYALALGSSKIHIGILGSLPSLAGSLSQLYTLRLMERMPRRKIAIYGSGLQALMWLLLLATGIFYYVFHFEQVTPILLIIVYTALFIVGAIIGPAWTSWMKDIVTEHLGAYFGFRNRVCGTVLLTSVIIAGFILDYFTESHIYLGFVILFTIAFLGRFFSMLSFYRKYEPQYRHYREYHTFGWFAGKMRRELFGRFTLFVSLMLLATAIAAPFFSVYMLEELKFPYTTYMIVIISSTVGSLIFMPAWGKFADKYGNRKVMMITGFGVSLVPILWLAVPLLPRLMLVPYLVMAEIYSGLVWAGFNLSTGNYIFYSVQRERVPWYTAFFNIITNAGAFFGAILGGILASSNIALFGLTSLLLIFLISGVARLVAFLLTIHTIKEVQPVEDFGFKEALDKFREITPEDIIKILR